jgi:hypothetical protein
VYFCTRCLEFTRSRQGVPVTVPFDCYRPADEVQAVLDWIVSTNQHHAFRHGDEVVQKVWFGLHRGARQPFFKTYSRAHKTTMSYKVLVLPDGKFIQTVPDQDFCLQCYNEGRE